MLTLVPHSSLIFNLSNYVIFLLAVVSVTGDYIVSHTNLHLFKALFDNSTHALIGGLSWCFVCIKIKNYSNVQSLLETALCAILASLIDLDHFVAAGSFYLKDATNLHKRPPLHCSTIPIVISASLLLISYLFQVVIYKRLALILLTAFLSHHTRDATRRGYWFYPFGSTMPIPYVIYVTLTCTIPLMIYYLYEIIKIDDITKYKFRSNVSVIV